MTRDWWVTLCDEHGHVKHRPLGEWLGQNRMACVNGTSGGPVAVALAGSLDGSQEAGRKVKRQIAAAREAGRERDEG
jgi:hypothetical protein